ADGKDDAVVFTPTTGTWQVAYSTGTSFAWPPITLITNFGTDPSGSYGVQGFLVEVVP
ncbi:MAG: hypothetical protein HYV33_00765, partial [Candidatus Kerfeldbacteria bacterium]|nr:hypothetical protein [Candidatus Kerfeldbacteria bacterium]